MKDQERGYMDLLSSFSKFQQLTSNLYPKPSSQPLASRLAANARSLNDGNNSIGLQQALGANGNSPGGLPISNENTNSESYWRSNSIYFKGVSYNQSSFIIFLKSQKFFFIFP